MRFLRNARIFRGQLEVAPFAAVLFLLIIFVMLNGLLYTPGTLLELPAGGDLAGVDKPSLKMALDAGGRFYYENSGPIGEDELRGRLKNAVRDSSQPLTLVVQADKSVTLGMLNALWSLARDEGISDVLLANLPRPGQPPANKPSP